VITDYVTFGYLTDVYVLESHQGKGLGGWMLTCLSEIIDRWPLLRRFILLTISPQTARLYNRTLGMRHWLDMESPELLVLQRKGRGVIDAVFDSTPKPEEPAS
jgi:GNAT superfamily N-acetyltransferase